MGDWLPCPFLHDRVELTEERRRHIEAKHSELLPRRLAWMAETLLKPESVVHSMKSDRVRLFVREYDDGGRRRWVVTAVVTDFDPDPRRWIVTAYLARNPPRGFLEWQRS